MVSELMRCQQDAVYTAEVDLPPGRRFRTLQELQDWVDDLRGTWWWEMRYARVSRVEVGPTRKGAVSSVGWFEKDKWAGRIEMSRVHWNVRDVTHELAHVIASALHESQAHDPWFAREYINLVYLISGEEAWLRLAAAFREHGVNYTPPDLIEQR